MFPYQSLAKIQIPQVSDIYQRKHLFSWLDQARKQPVIWISAGAGSGKTTLVASYLKNIDCTIAWYQVDSGDDDIASFFLNIGLAGKKAAPRKRKMLPHLTPEYMQNLSTFTRNYFRSFYDRLKHPSVLVLDNYQTVPEISALHEVLCDGLEEIPQGINVIVISRLNPPPVFARFRASGKMPILTWEDLNLTLNECSEIIRLRTGKDFSKKDVRTLYNRTNGWMAGLVLALEQLSVKESCLTLTNEAGQSVIYNYFDQEIFRHIDPKRQEFMLTTAILPQMTIPMAKALTGIDDAEQILRYLVQKNFFTVLKPAKLSSYTYHDLFRSFLSDKAEEVFDKEPHNQIIQKAAALLEKSGQIEEAAILYHRCRDWRPLLSLIVNNAQFVLRQGRTVTLLKWIGLLPEQYQKSDPWILYWLGECHISTDPLRSRKFYEKAFHRFRDEQDSIGIYQSWAGVIESYIFFLGDLKNLGKWVDFYNAISQDFPEFPNSEIEVRIINCMISALMFRYTHHKELSKWANKGEHTIKKSYSSDSALKLTGLLIPYCGWIGKYSLYRFVVDSQREYLKKSRQLYLARLKYYIAEAHFGWLTAEWEVCDNAIKEAKILSNQTGIHLLENEFIGAEIYRHALSTRDVNRLDRLLNKLESVADTIPALMKANVYYVKGWITFLKKDFEQAYLCVDTAINMMVENSGPPILYAVCHLAMVQVQFERGENKKAEQSLNKAIQIGTHMGADNFLYHGYCLKAYHAFKGHLHADGLSILKMAMAVGRKAGFYNYPWLMSEKMTYLCQKALENEIETPFVRSVIRKCNLFPETPPFHIKNWPWPVMVYTLGNFRLLQADKELYFSGKVQKKPLDLLKALIAFGGKDVPVNKLADTLWPDTEGDASYQALTMALQRLRKLLGCKETITLGEGLLTLDYRYCWVDVWAFERFLSERPADLKKLEQAIDLYKGPFLKNEIDAGWAIPMQLALNQKYIKAIIAIAGVYEERKEWQKAVDCYEHGLETEDLCEDLYQHLMNSHGRLGQTTQVINVFQRCCKILKAHYEIEPSEKTISLFRSLTESNASFFD